MKRMNRKKILEVLETARQGYSSLTIKAFGDNDIIMVKANKKLFTKIKQHIKSKNRLAVLYSLK